MRRALSLLVLSLLLAGCRRDVELRGTVALAEKVSLEGARLAVTLTQVTSAGATPVVRASTTRDSLGPPPWPFAMHAAVEPRGRWELRARLLRLGQATYESDPIVATGAGTVSVADTLPLHPVRGQILRGGAAPPADPALVAVRAGRDALTHAAGDAALGTTTARWRAWYAGGEPRLIEEAMEPAEGGHSELAYLFADGRLVSFEERGERAALLPGRPSTLARIEVSIRWPEPGGEPLVSHRIEGLDALPDHTLVAQVIARAAALRALAMAATPAH